MACKGHKVTLLLPYNSKTQEGMAFANENNIKLEFFGPLNWQPFVKSKILGDWNRKFGRLLFLLFEYPNIEIYFKLLKYLKRINKKYDLVLSIAVPHENHWAVAKIQSKKPIAKTWIADCGDPFVGNKLESIAPPFYFKALENSFLKYANYVTVPTHGAIEAYNKKYQNKLKVVPQGFSFKGIELGEYIKNPSKIKFAYAGSISLKGIRNPLNFIEYLLTLDLNFEFHVFSKQANSLKDLADRSSGRLILHNGIPRSELLIKLSVMDFLVNLDNGATTASPSKLIDYSLAKRPILNINPFNPETDLIDEFLSGDYANQFTLNELQQYNIENVVQKFLDLTE
jgi:hypothetical protein